MLFAALAPLLTAGMDRDWLPLVVATDAAPEYGFGTSVCPLSRDRVADLGRKAERRGDYIRLSRLGEEDDEPERPRLGRPHRLQLAKSDFRDVLCLKATRAEHASIMELKRSAAFAPKAPTLHLATSPQVCHADRCKGCPVRCRQRTDGRPGVPSNPLLHRRLAFGATDTLLRPVYIPSEDNPADAPSRGRRRRPMARRVLKKPAFSKPERRLHRLQQEALLVEELLRRNRPTPQAELKAAVARRRAGERVPA